MIRIIVLLNSFYIFYNTYHLDITFVLGHLDLD